MASRIQVGALVLSAAGLIGIVSYEGYSDKAYIPVPGDVPTIGFGTTEGVKIGEKITPVPALRRALSDINKDEKQIKRCVKVPLHQSEYDAYSSLTYNIGSTAFCNSTLVKKLNSGDYSGACAEISRWDKQGKKVLRGLTIRRAEERKTCEGS